MDAKQHEYDFGGHMGSIPVCRRCFQPSTDPLHRMNEFGNDEATKIEHVQEPKVSGGGIILP